MSGPVVPRGADARDSQVDLDSRAAETSMDTEWMTRVRLCSRGAGSEGRLRRPSSRALLYDEVG
jgi:hypothetical protein